MPRPGGGVRRRRRAVAWRERATNASERSQSLVTVRGALAPPTLAQRLLDVRDTTVGRRAPSPDAGEAIQAKRMVRQGQSPCRCRPVWVPPVRTRRIEAAPKLQRKPHESCEGRDGAVGVVGGPHGGTAARTLTQERRQGLRESWGRSGRGTGHRYHLHR
jgi:hypothetical protein